MAAKRKKLTAAVVVIFAIYFATAVSPLPRHLGRTQPEYGSLFYPPWFNFSTTYIDGGVLGFYIGMTRNQLAHSLTTTSDLELRSPCGSSRDGARMITNEAVNSEQLLAAGTICAWIPSRRISLVFTLEGDVVDTIRLSFVRNEVI